MSENNKNNINDDNTKLITTEVICVYHRCGARWMLSRPRNTLLKNVSCPNGHTGYVVETGQDSH